ncbi:hypothetical protein L6164_000814 [Bauhinia variegata]|uniref:Uncharacterized protein n=1 Tax=Bauhinia variegata TaxID=167791 RepID=A0ACB9Q7M6_BAUVA|nr:hypothetical protein L6164_000814 [Bauhinia variegata]
MGMNLFTRLQRSEVRTGLDKKWECVPTRYDANPSHPYVQEQSFMRIGATSLSSNNRIPHEAIRLLDVAEDSESVIEISKIGKRTR